MIDAALEALSVVTLPEELGLRRDHVVPAENRGPDFDARYDFRTLIYDVFHLPGRGVVLVCPKLLNLERVLQAGELRLDGRLVRPRRILRYRRMELVELPSPARPATLEIAFGGWRTVAPVHAARAEPFGGLNCLMTMSRDNALEWIRDWAEHHVLEHRAEALLFFDNASTGYRPEELLAVLAGVRGLKAVRVVPVAPSFGAIPAKGSHAKVLFLQAGVWNIARLRFLWHARAALPVDVDELVVGRDGASVFDAALARGFVKFRGVWRTADPGLARMPLHRDHVHEVTGARPCPTKYCVVPAGRLSRHVWNTHNLNWVPWSGRFEAHEFRYLHCRDITTNWKRRRPRGAGEAGPVDAETARLLERVFPAQAEDRRRG